MTTTPSPWLERFQGLNDLNVIAARSKVSAKSLYELDLLTKEGAHDLLLEQFASVFYPTAASLDILLTLIERAMSHASSQYPGERDFLSRCYQAACEDKETAPICITGLGGVGKTQIRKAFFRILPMDGSVEVTGHGNFPMSAARLVLVRSRKTVQEVLKSLARPGIEKAGLRGETAWLNECQRWLYQAGVSTVALDELQFLTQSESANTLVAQFLMAMTHLGPPVFFSCNYSLGHRLVLRPQEEQQRLLTRVHVLLPDPFETEDWKNVLLEYQKVAPDVFKFDFVSSSRDLWNYTAGIRRVLVQLLLLSYRQARSAGRNVVVFDDIQNAYHSRQFFMQRTDVEHLFAHGQAGTSKRKDLSCPFPIETSESERYSAGLREARRASVAAKVLDAAMTQDERQSLARMQDAAEPTKVKAKKNNVVRLKSANRRTFEALTLAGQKFMDEP